MDKARVWSCRCSLSVFLQSIQDGESVTMKTKVMLARVQLDKRILYLVISRECNLMCL